MYQFDSSPAQSENDKDGEAFPNHLWNTHLRIAARAQVVAADLTEAEISVIHAHGETVELEVKTSRLLEVLLLLLKKHLVCLLAKLQHLIGAEIIEHAWRLLGKFSKNVWGGEGI